MARAWGVGYLAQLEAQNPTILIDYANRIAGKPRERVSIEGSGDTPLALALAGATLEQILELARANK